MNELSHIRIWYFLGIGGIGMSALARWAKANSFAVSGYDRTATPLTHALEHEGIAVHYTDAIENIPAEVLATPSEVLVVYTPAIPVQHQEWNYLRERGFLIRKRSEVLGIITRSRHVIAVAGTHGKTSTSWMVAHLLRQGGVDCAALLGGISQNYESNVLLNEEAAAPVVVEADEYDRSFLTLFPKVAIITSTDADHLDIYGDTTQMLSSFEQFASQVAPEGILLVQQNLQLGTQHNNMQYYGILEEGGQSAKVGYYATQLRVEAPCFVFDLVKIDESGAQHRLMADVHLRVPGFHNVENAVAAMAVALQHAVEPSAIASAISTFRGVKRRFEYVWQHPSGGIYIDDYAHHPTEISAFMASVRALYPGRKLTAVFQPHLFSRTRDFMDGFAESLSQADAIILLPIYPARELPIEGISSEVLLDRIAHTDKMLLPNDALMEELQRRETDILLTIGAGDIDRFVPQIKKMLELKHKELCA